MEITRPNYTEDTERTSTPVSIADLIQKLQVGAVEAAGKRGGINSLLADVISQVMAFMEEYKLQNLLRNATKGEKEGYEEIRNDREKVKAWAAMVYNRRFKVWLGRTRKYHQNPYHLLDIMKKAKEGKNPQALFQWLLKEEAVKR